MEITFSRNVNYSLDLSKAAIRRELADHLDIEVRTLTRLVDKQELFDEHGDSLIQWMETKADAWEVTSEDDIEIEQILS